MSEALAVVERYETETFGGGHPGISLRSLPPGEPQRLAPQFAAIDPWARLGYKADALAGYLGGLEKNAPRYAIIAGNEVAGAIGLRLNWLRGPYLQFLGILPDYQKKKLGGAVLSWLASEARRNGEKNIWVLASTFNADALRFYEANGFARVVDIPDLVAPGTAEVMLRRRL